jgi:FAD binding domain-containing protein/aromatic ring hydroxylase-like protein
MGAGEHVHVLVVGAGPIGLALACHLRRLGLLVRVIEKRSGPSEHSKAIGLQYRVSEILARLGIVDRFIARGGSPTTVNIHAEQEPWLRLLRDIAVLPLLRRPWVQRRLFGKLSQLHVHYRGSSLSEDLRKPWNRRALRAGDRAPDVSFGRRDGTRTTLFALMGSMRPVVLFNGRAWSQLGAQLRSLDVEAYSVGVELDGRRDRDPFNLTDDTGDFAALYGMMKDFICLIRPDGHLGFVATATECLQLRAYLKRLCDPTEVDRVFG